VTENKQPTIELYPELDACVETQAKRLFSRLSSQLLKEGENEKLLAKLELLRLFLEGADFPDLRSQSEPHLVNGKKVIFTLRLVDGKAEYEMKIY